MDEQDRVLAEGPIGACGRSARHQAHEPHDDEGRNGETVLTDADGNPLVDPNITVEFDADGNPIFEPDVIDTLDVDRQYIQVVQEGMRMTNDRVSDEEYGTGATYVEWETLEAAGVTTAGKTGTAEFCDNIAIQRGWCRFEDIAQRRILPTHAWYVAYAPFDDPEIAVSVFVFNGGEGSAWATPIACHVIAAYFGVGQYSSIMGPLTEEEATAEPTVCNPTQTFGGSGFVPTVPQLVVTGDVDTADTAEPPVLDEDIPVDPTPAAGDEPTVTPEEPPEATTPAQSP